MSIILMTLDAAPTVSQEAIDKEKELDTRLEAKIQVLNHGSGPSLIPVSFPSGPGLMPFSYPVSYPVLCHSHTQSHASLIPIRTWPNSRLMSQ